MIHLPLRRERNHLSVTDGLTLPMIKLLTAQLRVGALSFDIAKCDLVTRAIIAGSGLGCHYAEDNLGWRLGGIWRGGPGPHWRGGPGPYPHAGGCWR